MSKSFLVIDSGGFHPSTAQRLADGGATVYYWCSWLSAYPRFEDFAPGYGVPGIKKIKDYGPYLDKVDVIMFPDIGMGGLAHTLREKGYAVFGAGRGEELEWNRKSANEIMDKIGLKRPETWTVRGFDNAIKKLEELLKLKTETNQNASGKFYVKFNVFRGSGDSFPVADIEDAHFMFNGIRSRLGPFADEIPVIIQRSVEGVECGADSFFDGENFLKPIMMGFESGGSYVGHITDDWGPYAKDMDKLTGYLRSVKYRGYYSFECMYDGTDCYYIDHTMRAGYPLALLFAEYADDFGALVYEIATGKANTSRLPLGKYLGCMEVTSEEALTRWVPLKGGDSTRFCRHMVVNDHAYAVPGVSIVAVCLGQGDSMDAVQKTIQKESEDLSIYFASFNPKFVDDIRAKYIQPMAKLGFQFGGEKQPETAEEAIAAPAMIRRLNEQRPLPPRRLPTSTSMPQHFDVPAQSHSPSVGLTIEEVVKIRDPKQLEASLMQDAARIVGAMK